MPRKLIKGVNDLLTKFPSIAAEAYGWNPSEISYGSNKNVPWRGACNHVWMATIKNRTLAKSGCSYCSGQAVLKGFNDLKTLAPDVAKYAHEWDPSTVTARSGVNKQWRCHCGYAWQTSPNSMVRSATIGTNGCHACSRRNFRFDDDAYLYLMQRDDEQQIGITNNPSNRLGKHSKNGWTLVEIIGPCDARNIHDRELKIKRWIRGRIGCIPRTRENWSRLKLEVSSIAELESLMVNDAEWALTRRQSRTMMSRLHPGAQPLLPKEEHHGQQAPNHRCS